MIDKSVTPGLGMIYYINVRIKWYILHVPAFGAPFFFGRFSTPTTDAFVQLMINVAVGMSPVDIPYLFFAESDVGCLYFNYPVHHTFLST